MTKRFYIAFLLLALCTFTVVQAQKNEFNPVYTGVTSLSIAPDARAGGLGDIGCATDPDVNSQYWNPAKYPFNISRAGLSFSYTPWLRRLTNDIDLVNVAGFYRIGEYSALSSSLTYFSLGDVTADSYTIRPYELAFDVAGSLMLSEHFSAAVALRFIYSDLQYDYAEDVSPGKAFGADIAFYYNNYLMLGSRECQLGLGLNASNIGSKISYDGGNTNEFIPTNLRLGASLLVPIDDYNTIQFSADANKLMVPTRPTLSQYADEMKSKYPTSDTDWSTDYSGYSSWLETSGYNDVSSIAGIFKSFSDAPGGFKEELREIQWSVGLEYCYHNQFSIRGGYHYEDEYKGNRKYYSVGAGFKMSIFSLDAAYLISAAQNNPLDQTLRFSLSFDMDGIKDLFGRK